MNATRRPDPVDVGDLRRFDALCDQFEQAWKRGARPVVADYLADVEATKRAVLVRQLLDVEFQERIARGEMPRADEYAGEDAELSAWIRARLAEVLETLPPTPRTPDETVSPSDESRSPEPTAATTPETTFGKFEVVERLGAGGMGAVYRARHTLVHYERAIKVLHPRLAQHASAVQRFLVEAQACIELSHPHIVTTYHVDQKPDGTIYLVMELLRGEDLSKLVGRTGPLPVDRAVTIVEQVASGLAYAHGRGTVHRDIKPHNILWTEGNVAKILDLGLARILEEPSADITGVDPEEEGAEFDLLLTRFQSRLTQQDAMLGTLPYMAPEQAASARDADGASDIYSLGCTLYFLLTGRHAFVGESAEAILRKHLAGDYIPIRRLRPDVPRELVAIVDRMMARSRSERFATADTVVTALRAWRGGAPAKFSDPIGLDDLPRLRDDLVRLKIITPQAWEAAETQARRQLPANPVSTSASVLTFQAATLESSHVLRELQSLHHPDSSDGLSEFQVQYLLNGDGDLLRLPHHILVEPMGSGWKGNVYRARHAETGQWEAIRTFAPHALQGLDGNDEARTVAFTGFVQRMKEFHDPAFPRVRGGGSYSCRRNGRQLFVASEFVNAPALADWVAQREEPALCPAVIDWSVRTAGQLCRALARAHAQGIWHLDLHGRSVLVGPSGQVHILDLGVALLLTRQKPEPRRETLWRQSPAAAGRVRSRKLSGESQHAALDETVATMAAPPPNGTFEVMPPEQWHNRSNVSAATDVYNLGCVLVLMLSGKYPFQAANMLQLMQLHLQQQPLAARELKKLPKALRPILERALAKSVGDRYPTVQAFGDELAAVVHLAGDEPSPSTWWSRLTSSLRKN